MHYRSTLLGIFSVAVFIQNVNAGLWGRSSADPEPEPPRRRKNLTCVLFYGNGACAFKCRLFGQGAEGYCDNLLCTCKYNDAIYIEGDNGFEPLPNSLAGRNTFIEPGRETPATFEDEDADDLTPEENDLKIKLITMMTFSPKHGSELCQFLKENNIDIDDVRKLSEKERKLNGGISYQPVTSRSLQSGTDILTQGNSIATRILQSLPESCERPLRGGQRPAPRKTIRSSGGTPPRKDLKYHPRRRKDDDDEDDDVPDVKLSSNLRSKHLPTHHDPNGSSHNPNRRQFTLNADTMRTPPLRVTTPKHKNEKNKSPPKIRKVPEKPGRFSFTYPLKRSKDLQLNHVNPQKPEFKDSPITPLPKYTVQPAVAEILPAAPSKDPVAGNLKTVAPPESTTPNPQVTSRGKEEDAAPKIAKPIPMRRKRRKRRVTPSVPTPLKLPLKEQDPHKKASEKSNAEEILKPQPQEEGVPQTSPEQNSDKNPEIVNPAELPTSKIGIENESASESPEKPDVRTNETQDRTDDRPNLLYVDNSSAQENPVPKPEATAPVLKAVTPMRNRLEQNPQKPLTVQMKPPSNHKTMELFDGNDTARKPEATEPVLKSITPMQNRLEKTLQKPITVQMKPPSNHQTIELFDSNEPKVDSVPSNEMMPQNTANNQTAKNPPDIQPVVPFSWAWPWPWFKEPPVKTSEDLPETSPSSDAEPQSQEKKPDPVPEEDFERSDEKKPNLEGITQPLIGSPNTEDNLGDLKQQKPPKKEANDEGVPVEEETKGKLSAQQEETFATPHESLLASEVQPESTNHEVVDTPAEKKASDSDFQSATPEESNLVHNAQEPSSLSSELKEQNPVEVGDIPSHPRENSLNSLENISIQDSRNDGKPPLENKDSTNQQPPEGLDTKHSHVKEKQEQSLEKDQNNPDTLPKKLEEESSPKPIASPETPYEAPLLSDNQPRFHEKDIPSLREEDAIASGNNTRTPDNSDLGTTNEKPNEKTPERIDGSPMKALDKKDEDFIDSQSPENPDTKAGQVVDEQKEPLEKEVDLDQMKEAMGSDDASNLINPAQPQQNSQPNDGSPLKDSDATDEYKQDSKSLQPPESPNTAISSDEPIKKELDKEEVAHNIVPESHLSGPDTPLESSSSPGIQNLPEGNASQPRKEPVESDTFSSTPDEPKTIDDFQESPQPSSEPSVVPPSKDFDTTNNNQDSILSQPPTNDDTVTNPNVEEGHENPLGDIPVNKGIPSKQGPEVQASSGLPPVSALPIEPSSSSPNLSQPEEQTSESQKPVEESSQNSNSMSPKANSKSKKDTSEILESQPKIESEERPRNRGVDSDEGAKKYSDAITELPATRELEDTGNEDKPQPSPSENGGFNIPESDEEQVLEEFEDSDPENPDTPAQSLKEVETPITENDSNISDSSKQSAPIGKSSPDQDSSPKEAPKTQVQDEASSTNPTDAKIDEEPKVHEPVLSEKKAEAVHNEEDAIDPEHPQIEQEQEVLEYEDESESDANAHPLTATKSLGTLNEEIVHPKEVETQQKPDAKEQPEEIEHEQVIEDYVEDGSDQSSLVDLGSSAGESDDKFKDQGIQKEADKKTKVGEPIESVNKPEESAFDNPRESSIPETAVEDPKEEASIPKQESPTVENASPTSNNSIEILDEFEDETFIDDESEDLEQDKDGKLEELPGESLPQNNAMTFENQPEETKKLNAPTREDDESKMEGTSMNNDKEVPDDNEKEEILHEFDDEEEVDDAEPHEEKRSSSTELTPEAPINSPKKENTPQSQETIDASHSPAPTKSDPMGDTTQPENPAKEVDNKSASNSDEETVLDEYTDQDQEVPAKDSEDIFSGLTGLAVLKEYIMKSLNK